MQDERSMILNMLKEGKISVEEADALLEVLAEGEPGEPGGFAAADPTEPEAPADSHPREDTRDAHTVMFTIDGSDEKHHRSRESRGEKGSGGFGFDFNLGGLKDTLRETMKGVSEAVKDVMGDLSELDLGSEIFRAMGKTRAEISAVVTESAGEASSLSISNKWGDVRVTGDDTEAGTITVRAEASAWGPAQADADEAIGAVNVRLERDGDTWTVKSGLEGASPGRVRIDYEISLPRHMGASVSSLSGDIWIEELDGEQTITTLSGDITIADLGSDPNAGHLMKTKSGDVVGGALTGDLSLSSASGSIEINGFTGNLQAATQSGDITIQDGSGSVQLKTMSGDIAVTLRVLGEKPVTIASLSGDVELELPDDSAVNVTAKSTSGDVDVDMDLDSEQQTDHLVVGTSNGGGLEVSTTTMSGDISISH